MRRRKIFVLFVSVCLIPILACNLASTATVTSTSPAVQAATPPQTQATIGGDTTAAAETALANSVAATLTAMPTDTPEFTFTPSQTPTQTLTLTPSIPTVTVSTNTNCRTGPGDPYSIIGVLAVGTPAQVVGRSADGGYWIILLPTMPNTSCWLWSQYATVSGNSQTLPIITPPPSPTPSVSFIVSYVEKVTCMSEYAYTFKINNNGAITWESVKIVVKDTVTSTSETHTGDSFKRYVGCSPSSEDLNLEPGEIGYVTTALPGQFTYNPSGHAMKANVTVCSKNGLTGTCLSQTITFTG